MFDEKISIWDAVQKAKDEILRVAQNDNKGLGCWIGGDCFTTLATADFRELVDPD